MILLAERSETGQDAWELVLTPRSPSLQRVLREVRLRGAGAVLSEMRISEVLGDSTVTTFSNVDLTRRFTEAERERRAKVIAAEGEFQASEKLSQAAAVLDRTPTSIQLRYLQTLVEIAADKNSTTIFPLPIDLLEPFLRDRHPAKKEA